MNLDTADLRILRELQADASLSTVALARRVHLSASTLAATGVQTSQPRPWPCWAPRWSTLRMLPTRTG